MLGFEIRAPQDPEPSLSRCMGKLFLIYIIVLEKEMRVVLCIEKARLTAVLAAAVFLCCTTGPNRFSRFTHSKKIADSPLPGQNMGALARRQVCDILQRDGSRLAALSAELLGMEKEMLTLQKTVGLFERGYYTADEHDRIEGLLSRYLQCRNALWELLDFYLGYREMSPDPELQTRGFLIGLGAAVSLVDAASKMIALFMDEPVVIAKINEPYPRSGIPAGTYDTLFHSITAVEHIEALKTAWVLFLKEKADSTTQLHRVLREDSAYKAFEAQITEEYGRSTERIQYIMEKHALLLPAMVNRLRHSQIAKVAAEAKRKYQDNLYAARGILFEKVSRVKSPGTEPIRFSDADTRRVLSLLQPGDIILTFTAGYMSNLFLPGQFKHGITYIGSPSQRRSEGLLDDALSAPVGQTGRELRAKIGRAQLRSGQAADVIEAVSEGVIYNSLDDLMKVHINRMAVLRPRLTNAERREALVTVFQLAGLGYDFKFDFNDGTYLCCTEVIYRALHGRGKISFPLTIRVGVPTLSADDIVRYYLASAKDLFDFVLFAEEDPAQRGSQARVLTGTEGLARLRELMK